MLKVLKLFPLLLLVLLVSCEDVPAQEANDAEVSAMEAPDEDVPLLGEAEIGQYGAPIDTTSAVPAGLLTRLPVADMKDITIHGTASSVCQAMGCWLKVAMPEGEPLHVAMADHAYFLPKNIGNRKVYLQGYGSYDTLSVEKQKHLLEDANASDEEIAMVKAPLPKLVFNATGVMVMPASQ